MSSGLFQGPRGAWRCKTHVPADRTGWSYWSARALAGFVEPKRCRVCHRTVAGIARERLGIASLEPRNRDRLDFHDLHVTAIEAALHAALEAGRR
jgi:hypothetical protein